MPPRHSLWLMGLVSIMGFADIRYAQKRPDGLYNVICMDYKVITGVRYEDIIADRVCDPQNSAND